MKGILIKDQRHNYVDNINVGEAVTIEGETPWGAWFVTDPSGNEIPWSIPKEAIEVVDAPAVKTFDDLPTPKEHAGGTLQRMFFDNGFGVSVVRHSFSYGGHRGLFEMAVLRGHEDEWNITYETTVTDDVLGYLTESDVTQHMEEVQALPKPATL